MADLGPTIQQLIQKSKGQKKPSAAEYETVTGKFDIKMEQIKLQELEKTTARQAAQLGVYYLDLSVYAVSPEALKTIDEETAKELQTVCFYRDVKKLKIAALDTQNPAMSTLMEQLKEDLHIDAIEIFLVSQHSFDHLISQYKNLPKIKPILKGVEITEDDLKKFQASIAVIKDLQPIIEKASISELVTAVISLALQIRASDIHIEAEEQDIKVRYRVDGILNEAAAIPKERWPKITSRVKLLSRLKINIENKPQDGRFTIFLIDDKVDVRVSVIPTTFGESIVMRLLRSSAAGLRFEDLGIKGVAYNLIEREIDKPNGMIITTGPTGSGKTTTLYAVLNKLNTGEDKIITLEDPVEYKLQGINQSQIDHSKGYSFADGLRSILRQDPDIIMVGEIRDLETADVAINAALTGHLVISTLHTNSAAGAIPRFLSMGVKGFLLAPSLNAIVGQRLVRRVCEHCRVPAKLDEATLAEIKKILSKISPETGIKIDLNKIRADSFSRGGGCRECHGIGFKGRIGIYEIMGMNKEIEQVILSGQLSEYVIEEIAVRHGMLMMIQDGLLKALEGVTTVEEVFRVAKTLE